MSKLGKIQYNTGGVYDTVLARYGERAYFDDFDTAWRKFAAEVGGHFGGFDIIWGKGVEGSSGVHGGWERLCGGQVGRNEGLVYRL
jgi:hypothetical protein